MSAALLFATIFALTFGSELGLRSLCQSSATCNVRDYENVKSYRFNTEECFILPNVCDTHTHRLDMKVENAGDGSYNIFTYSTHDQSCLPARETNKANVKFNHCVYPYNSTPRDRNTYNMLLFEQPTLVPDEILAILNSGSNLENLARAITSKGLKQRPPIAASGELTATRGVDTARISGQTCIWTQEPSRSDIDEFADIIEDLVLAIPGLDHPMNNGIQVSLDQRASGRGLIYDLVIDVTNGTTPLVTSVMLFLGLIAALFM